MPKSAKRKPKVDKRAALRAIKFKGYRYRPEPFPPEILQMAKDLGVEEQIRAQFGLTKPEAPHA